MNLPLTAYHCAFVIYMTAIPGIKVTGLQKQFMSVTMNRTEKVKANDKEERNHMYQIQLIDTLGMFNKGIFVQKLLFFIQGQLVRDIFYMKHMQG